jgi:type II secretory pathway pseudopilin PulG
MSYTSNKQKGLGMVEIMVVISVIIVSFTAILQLFKLQIQTERAKREEMAAYTLLSESLEAVRSIRDDNWSNLSSLTIGADYYPQITGNSWILSNIDPGAINGYERWIVINSVNRDAISGNIVAPPGGSVDSDTLEIVSYVEWQSNGTTTSRDLRTYLTNWQGKL